MARKSACYFGTFSEEYGYSVTKELLTGEQARPTAVIVGSAVLASGVILCCKDLGIQIPQQLSLVSFGDFSSGKLIEPRLTHVYDGHEEIGQHLVTMIQEALDHTLQKEALVLQPEFIIHDSVQRIELQQENEG